MSEIIFVLGGARSGKSGHARMIAQDFGGRVAFIATAEAGDTEMKKRIRHHKSERNKDWKTFEVPAGVSGFIKKISPEYKVVLLDCLTLLVTNMMISGMKEGAIEKEISRIIHEAKNRGINLIIVSNETGLGIVPENALAREFRDVAGRINQLTAKAADKVFFTVSGLPLRIK